MGGSRDVGRSELGGVIGPFCFFFFFFLNSIF